MAGHDLLRLIVAHILSTGDQPRTALVKLVYLTDHEHAKMTGRTATGLTYSFGRHGPYAPAIVRVASQPPFECRRKETQRGREAYIHRLSKRDVVAPLPVSVATALRRAMAIGASMDLAALLEYVYSTEPLWHIQPGATLHLGSRVRQQARARLAAIRERVNRRLRAATEGYYSWLPFAHAELAAAGELTGMDPADIAVRDENASIVGPAQALPDD